MGDRGRLPQGRPDWALAGAELVGDVAPYEAMKLRLLNASHSAIAYLGCLAGCETVADAMAWPALADFVRQLMDEEVTPTLKVPPGADVAAYKAKLLARFRNPALRHLTRQIAMDGTQKLPQRILETIRARLAAGAPFPRLALAVAAWMRYASGVDEQRRPYDVQDPLADVLKQRTASAGLEPDRLAASLLDLREVFSEDLARSRTFRATITDALRLLIEKGARGTLEHHRDQIL
jgi:fructuronate reductase